MGGNKKKEKVGSQSKNLENTKLYNMDKAGTFERKEEVSKRALGNTVGPKKTNYIGVQIELEIEDAENGSRDDKIKPKRRKWKLQARNVESIVEVKEGLPK